MAWIHTKPSISERFNTLVGSKISPPMRMRPARAREAPHPEPPVGSPWRQPSSCVTSRLECIHSRETRAENQGPGAGVHHLEQHRQPLPRLGVHLALPAQPPDGAMFAVPAMAPGLATSCRARAVPPQRGLHRRAPAGASSELANRGDGEALGTNADDTLLQVVGHTSALPHCWPTPGSAACQA